MTDIAMLSIFPQRFDCNAQGWVSAPGRVNLIGEFTDFNNGFVCPAALHFRTQVAYRLRQDKQVRVASQNYPEESDSFSLTNPLRPGDCQWGNYVRAVFFAFIEQGYALQGMDILITSDVPQGAGLSSSAALEVAIAGAIDQAHQLGLTETQLAQLGQRAENDFMNCQCGIMDQLVSACGRAGHAVRIDCEDLSIGYMPMPEELAVIIINSNYPRKLVESEYNQRRQDCEQAASVMGVRSLRAATLPMLMQYRQQMSSNQYKRAHHVISENRRVLAFETALKSADIKSMSQLMRASHQSLREDFEVTVPATDALVQICDQLLEDSGAARMTGGGFGGAVVCLCPHDRVDLLCQTLKREYPRTQGLQADIYIASVGGGLLRQQL